ncbi:hypothetical protein Syun_012687 [Stephania yunnanensis]|uniref:Uncharacterized protein n=1 Tax=Stephania yunnanensis TaxID=152371 RepID=A0AAP0PGM0_9MAGN
MHLWSQSSGAQGRDRWELREGIGGRKRKKKEEGSEKMKEMRDKKPDLVCLCPQSEIVTRVHDFTREKKTKNLRGAYVATGVLDGEIVWWVCWVDNFYTQSY